MKSLRPRARRERAIDERDLARAGAALERLAGLRFRDESRELLAAGLDRAALDGRTEPVALIDALEQARHADDELALKVIERVAVGETFFFRHPEHFQALREHVLPVLAGRGRPLSAWSAGCATGEEAYSLAIAFGDVLGWSPPRFQVLGTDVHRGALAIAERGRYGKWSLRGQPARALHLQPLPDGGVQCAPPLREVVRFGWHNLHLAAPPPGGPFDVIFCRNVLVYFAAETARAAIARVAERLAPGGWLFAAALDVVARPPGLEEVKLGGVVALRRRTRLTRRPPSRRAPPPPGPIDPPAPLARTQGDEPAPHAGPAALHLEALERAERGDRAGAERLLAEAVALEPRYVLGHLGLGLHLGRGARAAQHLRQVIELCAGRRDDERLPGPQPLAVSWVRRAAQSALTGIARAGESDE